MVTYKNIIVTVVIMDINMVQEFFMICDTPKRQNGSCGVFIPFVIVKTLYLTYFLIFIGNSGTNKRNSSEY